MSLNPDKSPSPVTMVNSYDYLTTHYSMVGGNDEKRLILPLQEGKKMDFDYFFFFYEGFLWQILATHRTAGEEKGPSFIPLYHFHPLMNIHVFICNLACVAITYF